MFSLAGTRRCPVVRDASERIELREGATIKPAVVRKLTKQAVALNESIGDPTLEAKPKPAKKKRAVPKRKP